MTSAGLTAVLGPLEQAMSVIESGATAAGIDLGEVWSRLKEAVQNPGNPDAITSAALEWVSQVKNPTNTSRNGLITNARNVTNLWQGSAAAGFNTFVTSLDPCYVSLASVCDSIAQTLGDTRTALDNFWIAMGIFAVAAAATITTCILAAIPTAGVSVAALIAAVLAFIAAAVKTIGDITTFYNHLRDTYSKLSAQLVEQPGFPNGHWPRPGVPINDGNARDKAWQVK